MNPRIMAIAHPADLLRSGAPSAARLLVAQETELPDTTPAAHLITAAIERLPTGQIVEPRERLIVMALTHLLLQVPYGAERERLTDMVEEIVGRCPGGAAV